MLNRRVFQAVLPWLLATPRARGATATSLQLVLAVDASGSVDMPRFELQRDGYAAAFRHPAVRAAIRGTPTGSIAVTVMQWTGPVLQNVVVDWTLIDGDVAADRLATSIDQAPRTLFGGGTSISGAIDVGATLFPHSPYAAERRVIDISGDGRNNRGRPSEDARDQAVAAGIVINGLPILALEPDLDSFYRDHVIGGPGTFLVTAHRFEDFAQAIRSKLVTEIAGLPGPTPIL
ncbi:MAG: DUF1194 domain-containing protein [Acetobacteraceae bacterium]